MVFKVFFLWPKLEFTKALLDKNYVIELRVLADLEFSANLEFSVCTATELEFSARPLSSSSVHGH